MAARAKKKTTTTTGRSRSSTRKKSARKSQISEIWSIPLFGLALLLLAMGFIQGDSGWATLRGWIFGLVGLGLYPLAVALVYIAYLIAGKRPIGKTVGKAVLGVLSWCAIPTVFSRLDLTAKSAWEVITLLFQQGGETWWSGGVAGAVLGVFMWKKKGRPRGAGQRAVPLVQFVQAGRRLRRPQPWRQPCRKKGRRRTAFARRSACWCAAMA